jgi:anti-anti-sigma regulatory factor
MTETLRRVVLPATFNHDRCGQLAEQFAHHRGSPVVVDAAQVHRVGTLAAQILLVAKQTWDHDVVGFRIEAPSAGYADSLRKLGLASAMLPTGKYS